MRLYRLEDNSYMELIKDKCLYIHSTSIFVNALVCLNVSSALGMLHHLSFNRFSVILSRTIKMPKLFKSTSKELKIH